jgi:hypothetical protein
MSFFEDVTNAALRFFPLGRNKASEIEYAAIQEGVPSRSQWYKMTGSDGHTVIGHIYVCRCATEMKPPMGGIFAWTGTYKCGCGQEFCLKTFLEEKARRARVVAACVAAGLSPNPTPTEIELSNQLGKKITVKSGPLTERELYQAYEGLPFRMASNALPKPPFIDTWDEKHGGSNGEVKYSGANPGPEDIADVGFGDPHSTSFRRR